MLNLQIRQIDKFIYIYGNELLHSLSIIFWNQIYITRSKPGKLSVDQKIRDFYIEAKEKTGYDILLLEVDEQKLIERGIISEDSYVKLIGKDKIEYIINTIKVPWDIK